MTGETLSRSAAIGKCEELAALVARHTNDKGNGLHATEIKQLKFRRESDTSTAIQGICEPILGIIQGQKEVLVNQEAYRYGVAQYLLVTVDLPLYGFAVEATPSY